MSDKDAYFKSLGYENEAAWVKERQDQCDKAIIDFNDFQKNKDMSDPDERRMLLVMMWKRAQNWFDWIRESQELKP